MGAVVWCLFGKTLRKSTEEAVLNFVTKKRCVVELVVNGEFTISRKKRPSQLIFMRGEENLTQESMLETQKMLNSLLKTNYKVFLASSVFGQHNDIDFVAANPDDKREILKNFLNMNDLFLMRSKIRRIKSEINSNIKTAKALLNESLEWQTKLNREISELQVKQGYSEEDIQKSNKAKEELKELLDSIKPTVQEIKTCITCGQNIPNERKPHFSIEQLKKQRELENLIIHVEPGEFGIVTGKHMKN